MKKTSGKELDDKTLTEKDSTSYYAIINYEVFGRPNDNQKITGTADSLLSIFRTVNGVETEMATDATEVINPVGVYDIGYHYVRDSDNDVKKQERLYEQPYSRISATLSYAGKVGGIDKSKTASVEWSEQRGLATDKQQYQKLVDSKTTATYTGAAASLNSNDTAGTLVYKIDFANKRGSGTITGLSYAPNIELKSAPLSDNVTAGSNTVIGVSPIVGRASWEGNTGGYYGLGLYGPKAEEVVGVVFENATDAANSAGKVMFGGQQTTDTGTMTAK